MSYNRYGGGNPYNAPPGYGGFNPPAAGHPPGFAPPGTFPAPGMAPPGMQQANAPQANRPSTNFQPPANLPNINFNAPVIRLGGANAPVPGGPRNDAPPTSGGGRPGPGMDRGPEQYRNAGRDYAPVLMPPTSDEKLRTVFIYQIPEGFAGDEEVQNLLEAVGGPIRWDGSSAIKESNKQSRFGFATFANRESLSTAISIFYDEGVEVPVKRQPGTDEPPKDDNFEGIEKTKLQFKVDRSTLKYIEAFEESRRGDETKEQRLERARASLKPVLRSLFYPATGTGVEADKDVVTGNDETGENVEVVNIPFAPDDELADIPAEMREVVAKEIAAFRERSNQRDLERLRKEEEIEEMERRRNDGPRRSRLDSPPPGGANNVPLGPRNNVPNAPTGPKGAPNGPGQGVSFVNGGISIGDLSLNREDEDTDASDEELNRRQIAKQKAEDDKLYAEAERKWANRERSRQAALERERGREKSNAESTERRAQEQLEGDKAWDDEREVTRRSHLFYRDHVGWARKRNMNRVDEEARDDTDRHVAKDQARREQAEVEKARGMADSFLDEQAEEMAQRDTVASAPQPFKLSLGAAAQKAQASRTGGRRTVADVEGLLDDEEVESTRRPLVPMQLDPLTATASMTEEEISQAVRSLAQEIPSEKEGLWKRDIKWDFLDEAMIRDKLRPFVAKKVVEYLGVQEEMLVSMVEEHLRSHGTAEALAEELEGALDDEAEDLVKKLWRMVIFFTECEKRGLPA